MSGTMIPMTGQIANPYPTEQAIAGIGQTQAQTGLIGQQTTAAAIQNYLMGAKASLLGPAFQGMAGQQQTAPPGMGGMPGINGAGPSQSAAPSTIAGFPTAPPQVGPYGAVAGPMGVAVPRLDYVLAITSNNPVAAMHTVLENRAMAISQADGGANDLQSWRNGAMSLYAAGYLQPGEYAKAWSATDGPASDPNSWRAQQEVVRSALQDPAKHADLVLQAAGHGMAVNPETGQYGAAAGPIGAAGQLAGTKAWAEVNPAIAKAGGVAPIEAGAKAQYQTTEVPVTNADGTISMKTMTRAQAAQQLGQPTGAVGLGGTSALSYGSPLTRAAAAGESGGNPAEGAPPGTPGNPHPTAGGAYQWTDESWAAAVNKFAPQMAAGKSQADLMALKNNLPFANAITEASFGANAAALTNNGYLSNNATVLLAHHYGLAGAQTILRAADASPNATLKQVLPDAAEANPTEANLTMQQIAQHWSGLAKGAGLAPNAPYAPPQPQQSAGPGAPATAASSGSPAPGTVGMGPAKFTPTQNVTVGLNQKAIDEGEKYSSDLQDAAATAAQTQVTMRTLANVAAPLPTGALGTVKGQIANYLASFGGDWSDKFMKATTGIDANSANAYQETAKIALQVAGMAENKAVGARGSMGLTNIFLRTFPGLETQPGALQHMANLFSVQSQYNIDHADTVSGYYLPQRDAFKQNPIAANVQPPVALDRRFLDQKGPNAPQVYSAAAGALNDVPYAQWTKGLAPDQIVAALKVAGRSNPTGHVLGPDGTPHIFQTAQAQ